MPNPKVEPGKGRELIRRVVQLPPFPNRPRGAHKGTFGRVLIVGGSRGMSGAVCLAGLGALRGGAGLVYLAVPSEIVPIVASFEPSYQTVPLPVEPKAGCLENTARADLEQAMAGKDAVAVGPGLGTSSHLVPLVDWLFRSVQQPLVLDADGLNGLAQLPQVPREPAGPRILTPHPGEFSRLISRDLATIQKNREELATEFAASNRIVLVLKGQNTIVTDGDRLTVNPTGNPGMATGGTGDVLTGLIAALLAQGLAGFEAAQVGVYLHGLAGDLAADDLSEPGLIASDLPHYLARAWKKMESDS